MLTQDDYFVLNKIVERLKPGLKCFAISELLNDNLTHVVLAHSPLSAMITVLSKYISASNLGDILRDIYYGLDIDEISDEEWDMRFEEMGDSIRRGYYGNFAELSINVQGVFNSKDGFDIVIPFEEFKERLFEFCTI